MRSMRTPSFANDYHDPDPLETLNATAKNHIQRRHPPKPRMQIETRQSASCIFDYLHHDFRPLPTEVTPLLNPVYVPSEEEMCEDKTSRGDVRRGIKDPTAIYWSDIWVRRTTRCVNLFISVCDSIRISEYALVIIPVVCIGHDSTTGLAAITLASMFAMVTGFSIINGFIGALDTVLPSTWTSAQPELAALWTQRIGELFMNDKHLFSSLKGVLSTRHSHGWPFNFTFGFISTMSSIYRPLLS